MEQISGAGMGSDAMTLLLDRVAQGDVEASFQLKPVHPADRAVDVTPQGD